MMKAIYISILGLTLAAGLSDAHAQRDSRGDAEIQMNDTVVAVPAAPMPVTLEKQEVQLPSEVTDTNEAAELVNHIRTIQAAQLVYLEAQTKYFQIMLASFEGSHAMSQAFDPVNRDKTAIKVGAVTTPVVTVAIDAKLAQMWLRAAGPSFGILKDIWFASRGEQSRLSMVGAKTWASLKQLAMDLRIPKNFITTATLGGFAYIQYENFWVINMTEAQYRATVKSLERKIKSLEARSAVIADTYVPVSAR